MKCKPIRQFMIRFRSMLLSMVICCGHGSLLYAHENPNAKKKLDEIFIDLNFDRSTLEELLVAIEAQTAFNFVYNEKILEKHREIKGPSGSASLGKVLRDVSSQTKLAFKRMDDNIHISEWKNDEQAVQEILKKADFIPITGTVTSQADGQTLPGVTIVIKGTSIGTITDINGKYTLEVNDENAVLVFSSIGYLSQEVTVGARNVVDVVLAEDVQSLEEVVVIGYGTMRREELTSSVVSISQKDFITGAVNNPIQMIDGKVAGLTMGTPAAADPNAGSSLQVRGVASVNAGTGPLIVVDGVPGRDLNAIPKDEIESITVLKDGASSSIYGARGANGVILVTTKKSDGGGTRVFYEGHLSTNFIAKRPEILSAQEYVAYGRSNTYDPSEANNLPYNNNFYDELLNDL